MTPVMNIKAFHHPHVWFTARIKGLQAGMILDSPTRKSMNPDRQARVYALPALVPPARRNC